MTAVCDTAARDAAVEERTTRAPRDLLSCPLCGMRVFGQTMCDRDHPPVMLSWTWDSVEAYDAWYSHPTAYAVEEQRAGGQRDMILRDTEALAAARLRLDALESLWGRVTGMRMVDIGCGTGAFVAAAAARGARASGIDRNTTLAEKAQALGRDVRGGDWRDMRDSADIITAHDLMEHLVNAPDFLNSMRERLHPGGVLVVEMPEFRASNAAWTRHIRPRQHVCLYTREAAESLYAKTGFRVVAFYRPLRGTLGKMTHLLMGAN